MITNGALYLFLSVLFPRGGEAQWRSWKHLCYKRVSLLSQKVNWFDNGMQSTQVHKVLAIARVLVSPSRMPGKCHFATSIAASNSCTFCNGELSNEGKKIGFLIHSHYHAWFVSMVLLKYSKLQEHDKENSKKNQISILWKNNIQHWCISCCGWAT